MIFPDAAPTPVNAQAYFKNTTRPGKEGSDGPDYANSGRADYLEGIKAAVDYATEQNELMELIQDLAEEGYLKQPLPQKRPKKKKEKQRPRPHAFVSDDGFTLFVGKNNKQNDYLTMKMAQGEDIWLHAKDIPGAHVIIRTEGKEIPAPTLLQAAGLAALFSQAGKSKSVPVDYTRRKYVRKPKGARPGMVIYERQKTIMAEPDEDLPDRLSGTRGQVPRPSPGH